MILLIYYRYVFVWGIDADLPPPPPRIRGWMGGVLEKSPRCLRLVKGMVRSRERESFILFRYELHVTSSTAASKPSVHDQHTVAARCENRSN